MARSNEPFWWIFFGAGMMVDALLIPAFIVITGVLLPLGLLRGPQAVQTLINHPLSRALLFVVISLTFIHAAHKCRFLLFDLGLKGSATAIAFVCYGSAIVGTIVAGAVALHRL
jgi:fumarate reductase subunit D